ncbi:MAG: glycosyltransferase family 39 protein, partial [Deltaproteobacteria bacterium]|nr:glycosyltransferase family 39 protein [Deltaproteobacteria bacterium]
PSLFYSGARHLFWMQHLGMPDALALDKIDREPPGFHPAFPRFPDIRDPVHYPVLPGFVATIVAWVTHTKLQWLDPIDGHHLGLVLLQGVLLVLFGLYACRLLGRGAGIVATLVCALYPTVLGHTPNNAKDLPCAMFYAIALMATGVGVLEERVRHLYSAAAFIGLGLAAKLNAAFVFPTLLAWSPIAWALLYRRRKAIPRKVVIAYLAAPFVAFLVFFITWPWLWYGGPRDWYAHLAEYVRFMANFGSSERNAFTAYPVKALVFMTPPLVLSAALVYAAIGWRGSRENLVRWALLGLWLAVPIVRIAAPRSNFYDSNRHFMEYAPALCAMAGLGAMIFVDKLRAWLEPRRMGALGVGAAGLVGLGALIWPVAEYHPYETTYFSSLIGGLGGAQQKGLFRIGPGQDPRVNGTEGDYWFSSARDAFYDLRRLNPQNAPIGICGPGRSHAMFNILDEPRFQFVEVPEPGFADTSFLYISPRETLCWWREVRRYESERPLLSRIERGAGLIYEILGPKDGKKHIPYSPETEYERNPDPRDKYQYWKYEP